MNQVIKRKSIFKWAINNQHIDFPCLQESFLTKSNVTKFNEDWDGKVFHALSDSSDSRGVSILFQSNLQFDIIIFL